MKKISLSFDDSLIISRLQQKELAQLKPGLGRISHALSPIEKLEFDPIAHNLPLKIALSLNILGTKIISAHVEKGFYCQNFENRLAKLSYINALHAIALLNQKTPIFYQLAFCRAMEELCALDQEPKLESIRSWALTYARVYHHIQVLGRMLLCLNLDNLSDLARTASSMMKPHAKLLSSVTSMQQHETLNTDELAILFEALENLAQELEAGISFESEARMILRKKAVVTLSMAASFGLSGIYLRANRSVFDASNGHIDGPPPDISEGGDAWARFLLRIREVKSCVEWLKNTLHTSFAQGINFSGLLDSRVPSIAHAVHPFAFGEVAGPEGDIKFSIFLDKNKEPMFYLRSPAYFIAQALPHLLAQAELSDLMWILHSLGINAEEIDK